MQGVSNAAMLNGFVHRLLSLILLGGIAGLAPGAPGAESGHVAYAQPTPDVTETLARARAAAYQASYRVRLVIPVWDEPPPSLPGGPASGPPPGPPPPPSRTVEVEARMDWTIQAPQRRFDAQIIAGTEHIDPGRMLHPAIIPDATGVTPAFYFNGMDAAMCHDSDGVANCTAVELDSAQWAMPFIGQSPFILFAFLAGAEEAQMTFLAEHSSLAGSRLLLDEPATCLTLDLMAPFEVCFSPSGVPVRMETPGGHLVLEATGYQLQVDASRFQLPAAPMPPSGPPLPDPRAPLIPLPPGVDPRDMAECLSQTGDPGFCGEQLTAPPPGLPPGVPAE
jgi:hypothetical protein